ncbi:carboxylesterase/lipase family protein [Henriciella litoralis]|uniref:carboxylesterase/lipase family protein n=1 Tax=Henriciella litoralis TaxID=568102 RepID=UPI00146C8827|nr:carboxylesterase/lipase family protein [Henriciella litoralis]
MTLLKSPRRALAGLAFMVLAAPLAMAQDGPIADTEYGQVSGEMEDGINVFRGIPYGADTADTRFLPAEEPAPWDDVRVSVEYPDSTPQMVRGSPLFASWQPDPDPKQSEDMLGLNVWTPGLDDRKRPVMVWLHGGGFINGNGSSTVYEGTRLANRGDVVVVTINHRLNMMGYLYLGDLPGGDAYPDSGNIGNLDMVMALEWVRDNIENFGGDPENVTIFGESGGGAKVSTLLAMPSAEGLFDRAIVQSGSLTEAVTLEDAIEDTNNFIKALGIDSEDPIAALKAIPVEDVTGAVSKGLAAGVAFRPVLDNRSLPRHPFSPDAPATALNVPMLVGTNDDERSLYVVADKAAMDALTFEGAVKRLSSGRTPEQAQTLVDGYREIFPDQTPKELYVTILSDLSFTRGSKAQAERKAAQGGAPIYVYLFDWDTPVMGGWLGAPHAMELGFTFDNLANSLSMIGSVEPAQPLADKMAEAWISFARHGNPNARGLPYWPAYDEESRAYMRFSLEPEVGTYYFEGEAAVLSSLD